MGGSPFQVPVNMAVQEPRTRVVSEEPDRDIIIRVADAHDVADDRVDKVISRVSRTPYHVECVPVQVYRVLV